MGKQDADTLAREIIERIREFHDRCHESDFESGDPWATLNAIEGIASRYLRAPGEC